MSVVVDTSVLIDFLRGDQRAVECLLSERASAPLHASEITRLEILVGMRASEESVTREVLSALVWRPVDDEIAEVAGALGREWRRSHRRLDAADLAIAATANLTGSRLLTRNVRHFPMFEGLKSPY